MPDTHPIVHKLLCTKCGRDYSREMLPMRCAACDEPLEFAESNKGAIRGSDAPGQSLFDRYADFLPCPPVERHCSLGEGFTPLVDAPELAASLGIRQLLLKNEGQNPTWSFKDRGTAACIRHAFALGYRRVGTVSSGNMGASIAAYGARAGLETFVVVGDLPEEKLGPIAIYGPNLIRVKADWDELTRRTLDIGAGHGIYFSNADAPMRIEGYKTISYEICEQTGFDPPDVVVVPTSAGGNIRGIEKGFREFFRHGFIKRLPRFVAVQPLACHPIHRARNEGSLTWRRFESLGTIAGAITNSAPASGNQALRMLARNNGATAAVGDPEMLAAQRGLAGVGLFVQPDSAASYAALSRLRDGGEIGPDSRVACILTAGGLKFTAAFGMQALRTRDAAPEQLEACIVDIIKKGTPCT